MKIKQPHSLVEAIGVARLIEEKNKLQIRNPSSFRTQVTTIPPKGSSNPMSDLLGRPPSQRVNLPTNPAAVHQISNQEAQERRAKGLCYYCDDKFIPGHRCSRPQLFGIEDASDRELEDNPNQEETVEVIPEISFHAIAGTSHPQTIRVLGKLQNKDFMVLIDGGSTHNFIDQSIVAQYNMPMVENKEFK